LCYFDHMSGEDLPRGQHEIDINAQQEFIDVVRGFEPALSPTVATPPLDCREGEFTLDGQEVKIAINKIVAVTGYTVWLKQPPEVLGTGTVIRKEKIYAVDDSGRGRESSYREDYYRLGADGQWKYVSSVEDEFKYAVGEAGFSDDDERVDRLREEYAVAEAEIEGLEVRSGKAPQAVFSYDRFDEIMPLLRKGVAEYDPQREITQTERQEFVDAVDRLDEHLRPWPPSSEDIREIIWGPEDSWSEELREGFRQDEVQLRSARYACFKISGVVVLVGKEDMGMISDGSDDTLSRGKLRWSANTTQYEATPNAAIMTSHEHQVGQSSNLPFSAYFKETQKIRNADDEYEGPMSEEEHAAHEQFMEESQDDLRHPWDIPAIGELLRIFREEREAAAELEELTGILPNLFSKARFDEIMALLKQASPANLMPEL
jgi:hypothetical protein